MEKLENSSVDAVLFLVEKGEPIEVLPKYHKYLFSQFHIPKMFSDHPDAFYIYYDQFFDEILAMDSQRGLLSADTELEISFYRPKAWPFDFSGVIIIVIAVFCVVVGSLWGARSADFSEFFPDEESPEELALTDNNVPSTTDSTNVQDNQFNLFSEDFMIFAMVVGMVVVLLTVGF